jgi:hypothetical protein
MHGGATGSGAQPGNQNALKHGHYGAESLALRRSVRALPRKARELIDQVK